MRGCGGVVFKRQPQGALQQAVSCKLRTWLCSWFTPRASYFGTWRSCVQSPVSATVPWHGAVRIHLPGCTWLPDVLLDTMPARKLGCCFVQASTSLNGTRELYVADLDLTRDERDYDAHRESRRAVPKHDSSSSSSNGSKRGGNSKSTALARNSEALQVRRYGCLAIH